MKYILIKNGLIVQPHKIIKGDMIICNNRILEIALHLDHSDPETKIIDVNGNYILPGLIHYKSPFLKTDCLDEISTIYIALSHGSTFLMDVLKITNINEFIKTINEARSNSKPIITDFSLHIDAYSASKLSREALNHCYINEGATSFTLKWKYVHKLISGKLDTLLKFISDNQLLLICETEDIKQASLIKHPNFFYSYLEILKEALQILRNKNVKTLITDLTSKEELYTIFGNNIHDDKIFAAISSRNNLTDIPGAIQKENLSKLGKHTNIVLNPPVLKPPEIYKQFIENKSMFSFLKDIAGSKLVTQESLLTICQMYATRPAKLLGAYPQKGALLPGSDADLLIWSPIKTSAYIKPGANTSLLRTDIKAMLFNGRYITADDMIISGQLNGRYIYRNPSFEIRTTMPI